MPRLEGVLTYVVENHRDNDGKQLETLTSLFFGQLKKTNVSSKYIPE